MNMPIRLNAVDDEVRGEHSYLPPSAQCFYWGEYTSYEHTDGKRADFSPTNRLVSNLKKKMSRRSEYDWKWKKQAITQCATAFSAMWDQQQLLQSRPMFVPMPPSRARGDADYDPRMTEILNAISRPGRVLDIRDCLSSDGRHLASHDAGARPTPDELYAALTFDASIGKPEQVPGIIVLFDDVLTSGAHFVAASRKLSEEFPGVPIVGHFVARRVLPNLTDMFDILDDL